MTTTKAPKLTPAQHAALTKLATYGPGFAPIRSGRGGIGFQVAEATAIKLEEMGLATVRWRDASHHNGRRGATRYAPAAFTGITAAGREAVGIDKFAWE